MSYLESVLEHIDKHTQDLIDSLITMIRIPSVNPAFDEKSKGEAAMADFVQGMYHSLGIPVDRIETKLGRPNIIATVAGSQTKPSLLVNCHLDTVSPHVGEWYDPFTGGLAEQWHSDPFAGHVHDGRIYGRGAADHKSPIAALLAALRAFHDLNIRFQGSLTCIHDADEETGGRYGMQYLAQTRPFDYDMVLYACSSEFTPLGKQFFDAMGDNNIIRAFAGWHTYNIRVFGQNLHNLTPRRGYGAVEAALILIDDIRLLQERVNTDYDALEGSGQPAFRISGVDCAPRASFHHQAQWCDIVVNRRISPHTKPDLALQELQEIVDAHNERFSNNRATLACVRDQRAFETPADHPLVTGLARAIHNVTGQEATITGLPAPVGISALLNHCDLPTVLFGYGYLNMHHAPNEYIDCSALIGMAKVYAAALIEWLGVSDG